MIIDQLPELTNTFDTDEIPIERGTNTYKTKALTFLNGLRTIIAANVTPWLNALGLGTSGVLPITIAQGGTNGTTAAKAKSNLGIGTEAQDFTIGNATGSIQLFGISAKCVNTNNTSKNNHRVSIVPTNTGLLLWDNTSSATIWALDFPIDVAQGGTGQTAVRTTSVSSDFIASYGSNFEVSGTAYCSVWGKVAMFSIPVKCITAISGGGSGYNYCTLKSGYRPPIISSLMDSSANPITVGTNGALIGWRGTVAVGTVITIRGVILLA